jgi:hypothetical protein
MKPFENRSTGSKVEMGESQTTVCGYLVAMKMIIIVFMVIA